MTKMNFDQPFSHALVPVKTLWFEFLLDPNLLQKHLQDRYADPSAVELIILFLNNAVSLSGLGASLEDLISANSSGTPLLSPSGNNSTALSLTDSSTPQQSQSSQSTEARPDTNLNGNISAAACQTILNNKKCLGLRLLAVKVAAHLDFNLTIIEKHLPINMQFMLLNELIKICEHNNGYKCSLFAYMNYYRWILRSVAKLTYPARKTQNVPIPLLQQIDPCYLPNETIENWARKLRELAPIAVAGLEKVIKENELEEITNIIRPKFECLKQLDENTNEPCFDWQQVQLLDTTEVMDTIQYELGKWFFFNEQYGNASGYFAKVSNKYESQFPHLADYKNSSMKLSSTKYDSSRNQVLLHNQFLECLDRLEQGEASDLYEVQSNLDPQIVEQELRERLQTNTDNEQQATRLKQIICYLACKDIRFRPLWHEVNVNCIRKSTNRSRKYGNGITNRGSETSKQTIEKKLLESIEPAHILELSTQVTRRALLINRKWELPRHHYNLLKNSILKKDQRIAIHIVLAKAFELRRARLYSAARTLFLSLLEDVQINFPKLAEVISYELLQTDLEIVARNPLTVKDKDPRRTADLSAKCEIAISKEQIINNISPNLLCYAGLFLLERDNPVIMDYLHSANPILKLAACLHTLGHSSRSSGATELWDLLVGSLSTSGSGNSVTGGSMHMNKRRGQIQFPTVIMSADQLILVLQNIRSIKYICLLISAFGRIHNLVRDNQQLELTLPAAVNWPNSIGPNGMSIELSRVSGLLKILLQSALQQQPNELHWLKVKAELALMETNYDQALHSLLHMLIVKSAYFTHFEATPDEEYLIQKMITCSMKLFCYTQAVILHQMCREINYSLVFKALAEKHCFDSCDDLYECIWDVTILEYLIHLHHRRGEVDRKTKIVRLIGQLELNANNAEHIRQQAAHVRRGRFFRYMAKKYL